MSKRDDYGPEWRKAHPERFDYQLTCAGCGELFGAKRPYARYCCEACGKRHKRQGQAASHTLTCAQCGEQFTARRSDAYLCSAKCRQAWGRGAVKRSVLKSQAKR